VVAVDPGLFQRHGVLLGEQAEAGTDLDGQLLLDLAHRRRHLRELPLARAAAARDDAVGARLARPRLARPVNQRVPREELVLLDRRRGDDRLRAVAAVLRADAALRVD